MLAHPYRTDGEELAFRIREAMRAHRITIEKASKKTSIPRSTIYKDLREPGKAALGRLLKIAYVAGIQQVTLKTGGTYR